MDKKDLKNMFPSLKGKWEDKGYYKKLEGLFEPINQRIKEGQSKYTTESLNPNSPLSKRVLEPYFKFMAGTDIPINTQQAVRISEAYKKLGGKPIEFNDPEATIFGSMQKGTGHNFPESPFEYYQKLKGAKDVLASHSTNPNKLFQADLDEIKAGRPYASSMFIGETDPYYTGNKQGMVFSGRLGTTESKISQIRSPFNSNTPEIPLDYLYGATTTAHEHGHGLDWSTHKGRKNLETRRSGKLIKKFKGGNPTQVLVSAIGALNPNQSLPMQMLEGAAGEILNPAWRNILETEYRADRFGQKIAKTAGTPWSFKNQLLSRGTYAAYPLATGAASVIPGYLLNEAADHSMDMFEHGVMDPLARKIRGGDTDLEASLRQYGYDPSKHNIEPRRTVDAPLQNVPFRKVLLTNNIVSPIVNAIAPWLTEIGGREEIPITRVRGLPGILRNIAMPK